MAGIMAFLDRHAHGAGGKLILYCFEDETYEKLEEKLMNQDDARVQEIFDEEIKALHHCVAAEINLDSLWMAGETIIFAGCPKHPNVTSGIEHIIGKLDEHEITKTNHIVRHETEKILRPYDKEYWDVSCVDNFEKYQKTLLSGEKRKLRALRNEISSGNIDTEEVMKKYTEAIAILHKAYCRKFSGQNCIFRETTERERSRQGGLGFLGVTEIW
mgnify:CR=1 FL=1